MVLKGVSSLAIANIFETLESWSLHDYQTVFSYLHLFVAKHIRLKIFDLDETSRNINSLQENFQKSFEGTVFAVIDVK